MQLTRKVLGGQTKQNVIIAVGFDSLHPLWFVRTLGGPFQENSVQKVKNQSGSQVDQRPVKGCIDATAKYKKANEHAVGWNIHCSDQCGKEIMLANDR